MSQAEGNPAPGGVPLPGPRSYDGSYLISKEMAAEAAKHDPYIITLWEFIEQDKAYIEVVQKDIARRYRDIYKLRQRTRVAKLRIENRKKQIKTLTAQLRKRLAFEKIRKTREELGLS